jgi:hypothetical protein
MAGPGFSEPQTEDEAQRLKRFLEQGATTTIEVVQTFESRGDVGVELSKPGTLTFAATADDVRKLAAAGSDRRMLLNFEVDKIDKEHEYSAAIFLNREDATAGTDPKTPGFAGAVGFFCEVEGPEGLILCPINAEQPLRYQLDVTDQLAQVEQGGDALRATLVLIPPADRKVEIGALHVARADVTVVSSVVKLG